MRQFIAILLTFFFISCNNSQTNTETETEKTNTSQQENKNNSDYSVYIDREKEFTISYPSNWDTTLKEPNMAFIAVEHDPDTTDKFNEGINVSVFPKDGLTLQQIVDKNVQLAKQYYSNPEIKQLNQITQNGLSCIIIQVKLKRQGLSLIAYSTFFDNGNDLFTVTATMEEAKKQRYLTIMDYIINSFNWTN